MGKLLFRLDDIAPDMNWVNFERICNLFEKYKIYPLLGVVPDNQDRKLQIEKPNADFWKLMLSLQQQGWEVAMHGYQHVYVNDNGGMLKINRQSEFAGLPLQSQLKKLNQGREILQSKGIHATIFMAPSHSYDRNTLKALKTLGFQGITDGYTDTPYWMNDLYFIPCTVSKPVIPPEYGVNTVCYHPNMMSEEEFMELEEFLQKHNELCESYHSYVNGIADGQIAVSQWNIKTILVQEKNQFIRKLKRFAASNALCQAYFQKRHAKREV